MSVVEARGNAERALLTQGKLRSIEAARAIAALAVVVCHAAATTGVFLPLPEALRLADDGRLGVDVFFVISGFIIFAVHRADIDRPWRAARYVARRAIRIWPIYWVALGLTLLLGMNVQHLSAAQWLGAVVLFPGNYSLPVTVAWTLRYETFFYAVFLLLILDRRVGVGALVLWFTFIFVAQMRPDLAQGVPHSMVDGGNLLFFCGMATAWALGEKTVPAPGAMMAAGAALFLFGLRTGPILAHPEQAGLSHLVFGVASALLLAGLVSAERRGMRVPGLLRAAGTASYSIYLFHMPFILVLAGLFRSSKLDAAAVGSWPIFGALTVCGAAGGIAVSLGFEQKLLRALQRRLPAETRLEYAAEVRVT